MSVTLIFLSVLLVIANVIAMKEDKFKAFLNEVFDDHRLVKFESDFEEKFEATVYCKLHGADYDECCAAFIGRLSKETSTNWIVLRRFGKPTRNLFRKIFVCQLSGKNKSKKGRNSLREIRNKECPAKVDLKWKLITKSTCKHDPYIALGLNCVIQIYFEHSHPLSDPSAMVYLRTTSETIELFRSYFQSGMCPSAAKSFHEIRIIQAAESEQSILTALANAQVNPTLRQVIHLYRAWRAEHDTGETPVVDVLKTKKESLEGRGCRLSLDEETLSVAVVTPLMKKVFEEFCVRGDYTVFVDSCGQSSKIEQMMNNHNLTLFFVASKLGALPIGCVMHTSPNFQISFSMLKKTLEETTGKPFCPSVILCEDVTWQRVALEMVFPTTRVLLSASVICYDVWKWLCISRHNVREEDRKPVMQSFHDVLFATTVETASEMYEGLIKKIRDNHSAVKYFENLWFKRTQWCLGFTLKTDYYELNMDDCETSIRILKDMFLQRWKSFDPSILLELISTFVENYNKERLTVFANSELGEEVRFRHYWKFCKILDEKLEVIKVDLNEYRIMCPSGKRVCTVNTDLAVCDCRRGRRGRYCEHLYAVEKKFDLPVDSRPVFTTADRELFARLAFGSENLNGSNPQDPFQSTDFANQKIQSNRSSQVECNSINDSQHVNLNGVYRTPLSSNDTHNSNLKPELIETGLENLKYDRNIEYINSSNLKNELTTEDDDDDDENWNDDIFTDVRSNFVEVEFESEIDAKDIFKSTFSEVKSQSARSESTEAVFRSTENSDFCSKIQNELIRISDLLQTSSPAETNKLNAFYKTLQRIKTKKQAFMFVSQTQKCSRALALAANRALRFKNKR